MWCCIYVVTCVTGQLSFRDLFKCFWEEVTLFGGLLVIVVTVTISHTGF